MIGLDAIQTGWTIDCTDAQAVGTVVEVTRTTLVVTTGFLLTAEHAVPVSLIEEIVPEHRRVVLDCAREALEALPPSRGANASNNAPLVGQQDDVRLPLHREQLRATKSTARVGEVRVTKRVRSETESLDVPVVRDAVEVRRVPADREARPDEAPVQDGDTLIVPVFAERVRIVRVPWVVEEIHIRKTPTQHVERHTGQVRVEEPVVETSGAVTVQRTPEASPSAPSTGGSARPRGQRGGK